MISPIVWLPIWILDGEKNKRVNLTKQLAKEWIQWRGRCIGNTYTCLQLGDGSANGRKQYSEQWGGGAEISNKPKGGNDIYKWWRRNHTTDRECAWDEMINTN